MNRISIIAEMRNSVIVSAIAALACTNIRTSPVGRLGGEPELYGAGVFSTGAWDFFMAWSRDQRDVFFDRANDDFSSFEILETRLDGAGHWSKPVRPAFAARWSNSDPHITVDGRRLFFISNRPLPSDTSQAERQSYDVWYADRDVNGSWGDAKHLDATFNDPSGNEWSPSVAANGNMYFGSNKPTGGRGDLDLWVARYVNGAYQPPENLGDSINTRGGEIEPWIAPDESYVIFSAGRQADSVGKYDLYFAERRNGVWQKARLLPPPINTSEWEFNPSVSPDGKWLYFSSTRRRLAPVGDRFDWPRNDASIAGIGDGKHGDIYRVRMEAVRRGALRTTSLEAPAAGSNAFAQDSAKHTWGFVTGRIDSRFSHYVYTGYGYDAGFLVGALVANPRSGYSEQILGAGSRLPAYRNLTQLAAITFCNASESRYTQLYYLPSLRSGSVSASATLEAYLPIDSAGVKQFGITSAQITTRVAGPVSAGVVYELSAAEHAPTSHGAGVAIRMALPGAELGADALRGLAHQQNHARFSFRAFY